MIALYRYAKKKRAQRIANTDNDRQSVPTTTTTANKEQEQEDVSTDTVPGAKKSQSDAGNHVDSKYMWKIVLCLWLPFFLSSLDLTVIATALPYIASHFEEFDQLNWAVTAFTLTSTAFIPLFGQLANTFGRHSSLQLAVWAVTIGSVICATAPHWAVLLLGRAIQGLGTAGVQNVVLIILADKVSLKAQARNTSIFQLLSGVGYAVGPVIGGYLTNSNWRYCFVLPAGIGGLSIISVFLLRNDLVGGTVSISKPRDGQTCLQALISGLKVIDFGGASLFIAAVTLIILGTAWGGSSYAWNSAAVIAPLVIGAMLFIAFATYEYLLEPGRLLARLMPSTMPMIPIKVLRNKDAAIISIVGAGSGAALYSVFYFIGIYFILVEGDPASNAGVQLLYYVPGLGVGVYAAIFIVNRFPRQTFLPLAFGTVLETAGIATLTYAVKARNSTLVNVMMGIAGAGTGARFMPSNIHLAGLMRDQLAPAYSMLRFSLPFGGTLALTIMGAVFQNKMSRYFGRLSGPNGGGFNLHNTSALDAIASLPAAEQHMIRSAGADATMWAFVSVLVFIAVSMLFSFGLGNVWISRGKSSAEGAAEAQDQTGAAGHAEVDRGFYMLHLLTGRVGRERALSGVQLVEKTAEPAEGVRM